MKKIGCWAPWGLLLHTLLFWLANAYWYGALPSYGHPDPKDIAPYWHSITMSTWFFIAPVALLILLIQWRHYTPSKRLIAALGWLVIGLVIITNTADIPNWLLD